MIAFCRLPAIAPEGVIVGEEGMLENSWAL